jgi:hypothetical protein
MWGPPLGLIWRCNGHKARGFHWGNPAGADIAEAENADAEPDRGDDAVTVGDFSGEHAAETEHDHGEGQRRRPAAGAELLWTTGSATSTDDDHGHGSRIHARRESGMNRSESRVKLEEISAAGATSLANAQRSSAMARDIGHADVVECGVTRLGGTGEWRYFRQQRK